VSPEEPQPLAVDTIRLLQVGVALWGVALLVSLLVPQLHQAERYWWPWTCVLGVMGGVLALVYVRRGRGNASMAQPRH
jgi:peptidoglycan/LPS O-acetylase OafA/YrhL